MGNNKTFLSVKLESVALRRKRLPLPVHPSQRPAASSGWRGEGVLTVRFHLKTACSSCEVSGGCPFGAILENWGVV